MSILWALLIFSVVVVIHEAGHFLLAKKNGIDVEEFSVGMGPTLLHFDKGGTRYCIKLLPLGGSCMMGEDDVASDDPGNFNNKSVWARFSVIVAGPMFNFILAFICSVIVVGWIGYDPPVIQEVIPGFSAEEQGLQSGDVIVKMNGKRIHLWREVTMYNTFHQGETIDLVYERDGELHEVTLVQKKDEESGRMLLGVRGKSEYEKGNVLKWLEYGCYEVKYWIDTTVSSLKMLVTGQVGLDQMSGAVGIVSYVGETYEMTKVISRQAVVLSMMNIVILLSANLGVMNLLPIPALDGGRLVFILIEAVRRKRIPPEKEGMVHFAGFVLLMLFMLVVMVNDVKKLL